MESSGDGGGGRSGSAGSEKEGPETTVPSGRPVSNVTHQSSRSSPAFPGGAYRSYFGAVSSALLNLIPYPWRAKSPKCVLLGRQYDLSVAEEHEDFLHDFRSRILFTYRHSFSPLQPPANGCAGQSLRASASMSLRNAFSLTGSTHSKAKRLITSDAGWGCMIRAFQMALAQAFLVLCYGRLWSRPLSLGGCRAVDTQGEKGSEQIMSKGEGATDPRYPGDLANILQYFVDCPEGRFSLHSIVAAGRVLCGKAPGQWFGPTSCAQSLTSLINGSLKSPSDLRRPPPIRVGGRRVHAFWCDDGYIDAQLVRESWRSFPSGRERRGNELHGDHGAMQGSRDGPPGLVYSAPAMTAYDDGSSASCSDIDSCVSEGTCDSLPNAAAILFLSLRLGVQYFNGAYQPFLQSCFGISQFAGLAGGGPLTSAYYFVGANQDHLFYLDPHSHCLPAFSSCKIPPAAPSEEHADDAAILLNGNAVSLADLESQFFAPSPKQLSWVALNPSMTLVFLCQGDEDFVDLLNRLKSIDTEGVVKLQKPEARLDSDPGSTDARNKLVPVYDEGFLIV